MKYKKQLADKDQALLMHYGYAKNEGADSDDAPYFVSSNTELNGQPYQKAGEKVPYDIPNDRESADGQDKHKFHLQLDGKDYTAWLRFTRGGYKIVNEKGRNDEEYTRGQQRHRQSEYQQYTLFFEKTLNGPNGGELDLNFSAQITEAGRNDSPYTGEVYAPDDSTEKPRRNLTVREDEYLVQATYSLKSDNLKHVYGIEATQDVIGQNWFTDSDVKSSTTGVYPDGTYHNENDVFIQGDWTVSTYSLFSEAQWQVQEKWTVFAGLRLDKHDYTDWFASPRAALVYAPNQDHIIKVIANESIKRASEIDMRVAHLDGEKAVEEKNTSIELIYETLNWERFNFATSIFHQDVEFWSFNNEQNTPVGTIGIMGAEFTATYVNDAHRLRMNHSYTKLASARDTSENQYISAKPFGYGDDLNSWSNHLTKLIYTHTRDTWLFSSSLRVYWGFDGAKDYGDYNNEVASDADQQRFGYDDDGEAYKGNYYLNAGLQKNVSEKLKVQLNAYNLMGLKDKKYSKRNYVKRFGDYRTEATALALDITYKY